MVSGREYFGGLLEQFVVQELRRQQTWTPIPYELFHYRQDNTHEVDIIVETDQGRLIPVEVKATSQPTSMHLRQLEAFKERFGDRVSCGVLLHTGVISQRRHDWLRLLPVPALWEEW